MTSNNKIDDIPYEKLKHWIEKANELSNKHFESGYAIELSIDPQGLFIKSKNTHGDEIKYIQSKDEWRLVETDTKTKIIGINKPDEIESSEVSEQ